MGKDIERDKMLVTLLAWNQFNPDKSGLRTRRILPGQCSRTYSKGNSFHENCIKKTLRNGKKTTKNV